MTDDRFLDGLDARGRAAGAGLRAAVADRPVPVFDPDVIRVDVDGSPQRRGRRRRAGLLLAVAAKLTFDLTLRPASLFVVTLHPA